jgi:Outer membrane receptor proteins, mostly Fe transport
MFRCACTLTLLLLINVFAQNDSLHTFDNNPAARDTISDTAANLPAPIDKMPVVTAFVKAQYPDSLVTKGIEGLVVFDLTISDKGIVDSIVLVSGLHPVLDSLATLAINKFTFAPAFSNGKPVPVILRYAYRFTLDHAKTPINEIANLSGVVREKGTRNFVGQASIALSFEDTTSPKKNNKKYVCVDKNPEGIPIASYLPMLGKIPGQKFEDGMLVTATDSLGRFSFFSVPTGTIHIKIIAGGYKAFKTKTILKKGRINTIGLWLDRNSYNDNEVVVYGKANDEEIQSYDVGQKELKRIAGFNGEAVKLVQALPGVSRPFFAGNEIIVRGADNSDSKYYLDGIELPYLYHDMSWDFFMYRGILNTDALQSVSLFPGGWGVGFGNAIGGIIDFKTRQAQKDRWHGIVDVNIKGLNLLFETPLGKNAGIIGSFRGNFLFDEVGFFKRHVLRDKEDDVQDFWDFSLRFDWQKAPSHHLTLTTIGARDTMYQFSPSWKKASKHDPSQESSSFGKNLTMGIAAWTWTISPLCENILTYGIRPTSYKTFYNESRDFMYYSDSKATRHDVRDELKYNVRDGLNVTCGLDMRVEPFTSNNIWYVQDTFYTSAYKSMFGPLAAYLACEWKPMDRLTFSPGLRYDYYTQLDYHGSWLPEFWNYGSRLINNHTRFSGDPSLRVSGKYDIDAKHAITSSIGSYNESPDSMIMALGWKKDIVSEKGSQYTLGYDWKFNDIVSLNCQGYFNTQWDKPRFRSSEELLENDTTYFATNGKARMEGLELMLRHSQTDRFFGWLSYSFSYSERYDYGQRKWVEYDYNSLNNIQLVANWFFKGNQGFGLRFQYTDGYPYTPYEVQLYDATYFNYIVKAEATNSKRHPPYIGLDLRYEKKFIFKRSMFTAYIEGERLLHLLQYVKDKNGNPLYHPGEYNQYNYDYSAFESQAMWPMGSLGLTWEF